MEFLEWLVVILLLVWAGVVIFNRVSAPFTPPSIKMPYGSPPPQQQSTQPTQQSTHQPTQQHKPQSSRSFAPSKSFTTIGMRE